MLNLLELPRDGDICRALSTARLPQDWRLQLMDEEGTLLTSNE